MNRIILAWVFISLILLLMFLEGKNDLADELAAPGRDETEVSAAGDMLADFENFAAKPAEQV